MTEKEFLESRIYDVFTTMGIAQVASFMRAHEDFYIVTDIKDDNYEACKFIADHFPDIRDRVIVQIYSIGEYDEILSLGFNNMIFTLYRTEKADRQPERLLEDIKKCDLCALTYWSNYVEDENFWSGMENCRIPMFVHTVDDQNDISGFLKKGLFIYTDNTNNEWMR